MTFYKIRHKPTGLYFRPASGSYRLSLCRDGETYHKKPSLKTYERVPIKIDNSHLGYPNKPARFNKADWVIEKYDAAPVEIDW